MAKPQKNLVYAVLLDHYGPALTEKQREILHQYYDEDLSLAEIAENFSITRQGVRDAIKHGEAALDALESQLGMAKHYEALQRDVNSLRDCISRIRCENAGSYTTSARIAKDTAEALQLLEHIETTQEGADGI